MATIDPATTKRPLAPPDRALIAETIQTRLPFHGTFKKLLPLAGDASNRRYFRIELSGNASAPSFSCSWLSRKPSNSLKRP